MQAPAIFLDKDGTLIENVPFNVDPARIRLLPGAAAALQRLHALGYCLIVISNQSGVAHGRFDEADLDAVWQRLWEIGADIGVPFTGFYYCPHDPAGSVPAYAVPCVCRKPAPGLLLKAAAEHRVPLEASWFIGDILDDVEAGRQAGCHTILLDNGHETEWRLAPLRTPHYTVKDWAQAVEIVASFTHIGQFECMG